MLRAGRLVCIPVIRHLEVGGWAEFWPPSYTPAHLEQQWQLRCILHPARQASQLVLQHTQLQPEQGRFMQPLSGCCRQEGVECLGTTAVRQHQLQQIALARPRQRARCALHAEGGAWQAQRVGHGGQVGQQVDLCLAAPAAHISLQNEGWGWTADVSTEGKPPSNA